MPEPSTLDHRSPPSGSTRPDPAFWGEQRPRRTRVPRPAAAGVGVLRERFDEWRSDARMGVAILIVVAVVAGILWYRIGVGGGDDAPAAGVVRSTATTTASGTAPPRASDTPTTDKASSGGHALVVHVAGAVSHPGVVELPSGSRVIDAIEAAGGGLADADLDRLNLAAKLADGQRVLVVHVGEVAVPDATGGGSDAGSGTEAAGGLVNLNTATQAELEELPGLGPSLAGAIIDERTRRGGFQSINELRDVRGIGEKRFADLREKVTV